jgi:metal-responsive CopG/Arc/MetJ family transcriptional regulator
MIIGKSYQGGFMHTRTDVDRVTISLPHTLASQAETLRAELKLSRSELYKIAMERFIEEQRRSHLATIAAEMAEEYRTNRELTALTALDGEEFA